MTISPSATSTTRSRRVIERPWVLIRLGGVYASSRALGLLREMGVAFFFGTSAAADRLSAAFVVASLISTVVGEACYAGSVRWLAPTKTDAGQHLSEARYAALVLVGRRASVAAMTLFAIVGPIATMIVLGRTTGALQTALLAAALAPSVGASLFQACVNARLTLERRFVLLNMAQTLYSAGALVGLAVIALAGERIGPVPVAVGWSLGNVASAWLLYLRARPRADLESTHAISSRGLLWFGLPLATAYSLFAVEGLTDRMVAARLGQGRVAALSYADRLFLLPIGFVIAALGPMVLGALVVGRGTKDLTRSANEQLQTLVAAIVPLSLLFVALAPNLVSLVFESGNFNAHSRVITQQALDGFSVGIGAVAVSLVLFRAMQAVGRLRQIVFIAVAAVVFNAVTTVGAGIWLGLYGVTLSTSLVAIATVCLQTEGLVAEFGRPWSHRIYKSAVFPVIGCCAVSLTIVSISHAGVLEERGRVMVSVLATLVFGLLLNLRRRQTQ